MKLNLRAQRTFKKYQQKFKQITDEFQNLEYVLQGSIAERWMLCGKKQCPCHSNKKFRHGPYYQWSWKENGRTNSVYLDKENAKLCKKWIHNNKKMVRLTQRLHKLSLKVARLNEFAPK